MERNPQVMLPRGIDTPVLAVSDYLDNFEPAELQPDWEYDFTSRERQESLANLVRLLEMPLSKSTLPELRKIETHTKKIKDSCNTNSKEHVVRIGENAVGKEFRFAHDYLEADYRRGVIQEDFALRVAAFSGSGLNVDKWLVPLSSKSCIEINMNQYLGSGKQIPFINSQAPRSEVELALNRVGTYFQERYQSIESMTLGEKAAIFLARITLRI